jgi:hypothetical protein
MNSFSIKLGTLSQSGAATSHQLDILSCVSEHGDMVELSLRGVIVLTGGTR